MAPAQADVDWLVNSLTQARVLDAHRARSALTEFRIDSPFGGTSDAARFFVRQGILTQYQMDRALEGEADKLLLGPYLLLEPLGQGNLGTVYLGVHRGDRQRFAIKTLPLRSLWRVMEAKKLAATIAAMPPHPVVVPLAEINTASGLHYLSWPFVEGENLELIVKQFGPLMHTDAVRIMAGVADGLAACHNAGLVHGLLKPSNILLGTDRQPRILDLGIGAILADNTDPESMIDTISSAGAAMDMMDFTAPEICVDPTLRLAPADIYSFGCSLYFLLTGVTPFPDGTIVDKMVCHQTKTPPLLSARNSRLPAELVQLVAQMLSKNPMARPTAEDVRDRLKSMKVTPVESASPGGQSNRLSMAMEKIRAALAEATQESTGSGDVVPPIPKISRPLARDPNDSEGAVNFDTIIESPDDGPITPRSSVRTKPRIEVGDPEMDSELVDEPRHSSSYFRMKGLSAPPRLSSKLQGPSSRAIDLPPMPVNVEGQASSASNRWSRPEIVIPPVPVFPQSKLSSLAFWKAKEDVVQLSVFGPPELEPGQKVNFHVYMHTPETFANARTLCRALKADAELLGVGYVGKPVPRGTELSLHMALGNAGVAKSLTHIHWIGQMQPRTFEIFVPWESPPRPRQRHRLDRNRERPHRHRHAPILDPPPLELANRIIPPCIPTRTS